MLSKLKPVENRRNSQELVASISGRKGSDVTLVSNDRTRKMSHDVTPNIDNYRSRYQVQATVRPTIHEVYNTIGGKEGVC